MSANLQNALFSVTIDPCGTFAILQKTPKKVILQEALSQISYWLGRKIHNSIPDVINERIAERKNLGKLGDAQVVRIALREDENRVQYDLVFALPESYPLVLWKIVLTNHGEESIEPEQLILLKSDQKIGGFTFGENANLAFFANGWQSWSLSGTYGANEGMRQTRLGYFQGSQWINSGTPTPRKKGHFACDFFGVIGDRISRQGYLVGFLSQWQHFGVIEANLRREAEVKLWAVGDRAILEGEESIETDWAVIQPVDVDDVDPIGAYLDAVAAQNEARIPKRNITGWCSWYEFYSKISEEKIQNNLKAIRENQNKLPLDLVQIDDGYETRVGDWSSFKEEFPSGVNGLAKEIKNDGFTPGLWLAPFIVDPRSELAKNHPDYLLRDRKRKPVNSGFNWDIFTFSLDLTNSTALEYICSDIQKAVKDWGYSYLKLDFLYAAALEGLRKNPKMTRAQTLRKGMEAVRNAAGEDTFLLGCGAPIGSMIGIVDGMRIGADVSGEWRTIYKGIKLIFNEEPNTPCLRNAIQNTITRSGMHNRWWLNDPDCLLIRHGTHLSLDEIQAQASIIGLTGGMLLLSDNLPAVPEERRWIAEVLIPVINQRPIILDWFDQQMPSMLRLDIKGKVGDWSLVGIFNWEDRPKRMVLDFERFHLQSGSYFAKSFWDGKSFMINGGQPFDLGDVPAHGGLVLAIRNMAQKRSQYLGGNLHFSQGLEVEEWQELEESIVIQFNLPRKYQGNIDVYIPNKPQEAWLDGNVTDWSELGNQCYRFFIEGEKTSRLEIKC